MATNQQAIIRYQALDKCLSNFGRKFYFEDLLDACNKAIYDYTGREGGIKRRQLFEDIKYMESEAGYAIPLEKVREGRRIYYRYAERHYSIKNQPISPSEAEQLKSTLIMLNRFNGLPQFDWMEEVLARFEKSFSLQANVNGAVGFEHNPYLKGLEHFTSLFNAIVYKRVLHIGYKPFGHDSRIYEIHPYYLKQYNSRWFLLGLNSTSSHEQLMNMALDRVESIEEISARYKENTTIDFDDYFADIVGVTIPAHREVETILLKIDKGRYPYIETKPLHESQTILTQQSTEEQVMVKLRLIPNYEFETLLLSFADSVDIIEPLSLKETISNRAKKIYERHK